MTTLAYSSAPINDLKPPRGLLWLATAMGILQILAKSIGAGGPGRPWDSIGAADEMSYIQQILRPLASKAIPLIVVSFAVAAALLLCRIKWAQRSLRLAAESYILLLLLGFMLSITQACLEGELDFRGLLVGIHVFNVHITFFLVVALSCLRFWQNGRRLMLAIAAWTLFEALAALLFRSLQWSFMLKSVKEQFHRASEALAMHQPFDALYRFSGLTLPHLYYLSMIVLGMTAVGCMFRSTFCRRLMVFLAWALLIQRLLTTCMYLLIDLTDHLGITNIYGGPAPLLSVRVATDLVEQAERFLLGISFPVAILIVFTLPQVKRSFVKNGVSGSV